MPTPAPTIAKAAAPRAVSVGWRLELPSVIGVPYVVAGQGGATATVRVANAGDVPLTGLSWVLNGDPTFSVAGGPSSLGPGEHAELRLNWTGSATETITRTVLSAVVDGGASVGADVSVFAVAGDPGLGAATWEPVEGAGGVMVGEGATIAMPAAPYPDGTSRYFDPSVRVFLPAGYRERGAHDLVVHFHGWTATLTETLATHLYQQHLYASGSNAVLVVPQGPVNAQSGDFGKLMQKGGIARLLHQVLAVLYRERKIAQPVRGDLILTAHSGGYQAVSAILDPVNGSPLVSQVDLFDALYGFEAIFGQFAAGGGILRSNYTEYGGAMEVNQSVAAFLGLKKRKTAIHATQRALAADDPVINFVSTSHVGTTRYAGAYGETLRWKLPHSRRGPRVELREVRAAGGRVTVRWLSPPDEDLNGFLVERSLDGTTWTTALKVGPTATSVTLPLSVGSRFRVKPLVSGVAPAEALPSDAYRVDPEASVLVVDGFDRVIDGSFGGLHHDFAAVVGEALGPVATISHRAIGEDRFQLGAFRAVVWLSGDSSTGDVTLSNTEQVALLEYLRGGGHLVMSGSDVAFDLGSMPAGATFLERAFGAAYVADDAHSREVMGYGPLASLSAFPIGGPGAPYRAASPDVIGPLGGVAVMEYSSGHIAAVGRPGKSVLVGFPLELCGSRATMAKVARSLLNFVGGP